MELGTTAAMGVFVGRGVRDGFGEGVMEGVQVGSIKLRSVEVGKTSVGEGVLVGAMGVEDAQADKIKASKIDDNNKAFIHHSSV